jgi:hypothetical protein
MLILLSKASPGKESYIATSQLIKFMANGGSHLFLAWPNLFINTTFLLFKLFA